MHAINRPKGHKTMRRYMLDTNVFNHILDGKVGFEALAGKDLVATHVQRDELAKTKDESRKEALLKVFAELTPDQAVTTSAIAGVSVADGAAASGGGVVPTESAAWGVSRWGQAKWGAEDDIFAGMRADLDALNKRKGNNVEDILIAETAIRNQWMLITSDADLFAVVTKYGGSCANVFALCKF